MTPGVAKSLTRSEAVKNEIEGALANGFEVSVHENTLSANGFSGVGYVIIDPATGAGAWKISGGANGAMMITNVVAAASCIPKSAANYLNLVLENYKVVGDALFPWWVSIPGLNPYTAATSTAIASLLGGITLGAYVGAFSDLAIKGVAGSWMVVYLATAILNGILINGALKTGMLIGSIVSPKVLRETMESEVCK